MMDRTDRHFRLLLRLLAPDLLLYTEMVVAQAILRGDQERLLGYDEREHPLVLQLGGSDPDELARAAGVAERRGYDAINLNIGCPSERVQSGSFGACLMAEPALVAACVAAIRQRVALPVTVKTRIGIDARDDYGFLRDFVDEVQASGCSTFIVHARKAILAGLSPAENRSIPPLNYERVYRLKEDCPELTIVLNGGVRSTTEVLEHLQYVDGVMIGRQAYKDPYWIGELQQAVAPRANWQLPTRSEVVEQMRDYAERTVGQQGVRLRHIARHLLGLYAGRPGSRAWRRFLTEGVAAKNAAPELLSHSLKLVERTTATSGSPCCGA